MDNEIDPLVDEFLKESFLDDSLVDELNQPEIEIETDDLKLILRLKKDYSKITTIDLRKEEFLKDLDDFINEFKSRDELTELMEYFDI